jgi:hypothetical protein
VAYGAAATSASRLAVIAPLYYRRKREGRLLTQRKKITGAQKKNPAKSHRLFCDWRRKIVNSGPRERSWGEKNFFAALSFRFEFCYYDAAIDLDPAIIWRYPTVQMHPAI